MSETKKKRVNKTKEELVEKIVDNQIDGFKAGLKELEEKFGYRLEPTMAYTKMGVFPQIEVQRIIKKEQTESESVV